MEEENRKASRSSSATRQEVIDRRHSCELELGEAQRLFGEAQVARQCSNDQSSKLGTKIKDLQSEITQIQTQIDRFQSDITKALQVRRDGLSAYGPEATRVKKAIESAQWIEPPLGPLGEHVILKDPSWSMVLESNLNNLLTSYIVTNKKDRDLLRDILKQCNW